MTFLTLGGDLGVERFGDVASRLEELRATSEPLVVDLERVTSVDALIAMDLLVFLRRRLRHGMPMAIVRPKTNGGWITTAASLAEARFFDDRESAMAGIAAA